MMDHFGYSIGGNRVPVPYNDAFNDSYQASKCKVTLKNKELWKKFHSLDTEMIITKSGRRMFPSLQVQVADLDPQAHYCIYLEMVPASRCRYKYSSSGGWAPAGSEEAQSPQRVYLHPESPAKGEYWMSQPVSFGRVKLTNTPAPPAGQIVLTSMHKYQPRIVIVKTTDPRAFGWSNNSSFTFPETQFIAVTAYQNEKITQLKIDNNPFAKGFRENGQAKCKRKRVNMEEKDEEIDVIGDGGANHNNNNDNSNLERDVVNLSPPRSRTSSECDGRSQCSSPLSTQGSLQTDRTEIPSFSKPSASISTSSPRLSPALGDRQIPRPFSYPPPLLAYPSTPFYPYFPYPPYSAYHISYYPQYAYHPQNLDGEREAKRPKKLTDFSIKAIMGF